MCETIHQRRGSASSKSKIADSSYEKLKTLHNGTVSV